MKKESLTCDVVTLHPDKIQRIEQEMPAEEQFQELSVLFKMFSDPTRLKILSILFHEEVCVCDLTYLLQVSQSAISHQLSILRQNRLVKYRRQGKNIFYSLDDMHIQMIYDAGFAHILEEKL